VVGDQEQVKVLRKKLLNAKPFGKEQLSKSLDSNFITMDIETVKNENKISPYFICAYKGKDYITSCANDSLIGGVQQKDLFNNFINNLLTFLMVCSGGPGAAALLLCSQ
jgi:hypothetical protein